EIVDPDTGDGQGNCNLSRTSMAEALADWLATDPTGSGDPDFLIMGDLNAHAQEDPVESLRTHGYVDLLDQPFGPAAPQPFTFHGLAGALDHQMPNAALRKQVAGATVWHINDDEPPVLDYNTEFNPAGYYQPNVFRSSDHDPALVGLTLCVDRSDVNALLA